MDLLFKKDNLLIIREQNPLLANLGRAHDELITRFNFINQKIYDEVVPDNPGKSEKEKYDQLHETVDTDQVTIIV